MPSPDEVQKLLPLVREYGQLERRRTDGGVTPSEFQRWSDLRDQLEGKFPQGDRPPGGERRRNLRLPTKMLIEFSGQGELRAALIRNISRGGMFIATPFAPDIGTHLELVIQVGDGEKIVLPVQVVSTSMPDRVTQQGVGCKFGTLDERQQAIVDELFATAIDGET